jgi:hypothetical protein
MQLAAHLNAVLGTTHITPWTLDAIPQVWIERIVKMANMRASMAEQGLIK